MSKHSRKRRRDYDSESDIRKKIRKLEKKLKRRRYPESNYSDNDSASDDSVQRKNRLLRRNQPPDEDKEYKTIESDSERSNHYDPCPNDGNDHDTVVQDISVLPNIMVQSPPTMEKSIDRPSTSTEVTVDVQSGQAQPATSNETIPTDAVPELDKDILDLLGETPSKDRKYGSNIKNELAVRWTHILTTGLTKETKKELIEKYLTPDNCKNIDAPILNTETKAALSEMLVKKDKAIEYKQKQRASALSCLGEALTKLLDLGYKEPSVIRPLLDAARLVCDLQHTDSLIRRSFICSTLKKEIKDQLYATEIDKYLFSEKLADTLKAAKAIHKSGSEMKVPPPKQKKPATSNRPLNSKPQLPSSRSSGVTRKQEPVAETSRRNQQPAHSSTAGAPNRSQRRSQAPYHRRR